MSACLLAGYAAEGFGHSSSLEETIPSGQSKDRLLLFDKTTGKCGYTEFKRYQMIRAQSIRDGTKAH